MPVSLHDIACGFVAPAAAAGAVMVLVHRLFRDELAGRLAATVALVGGFTLGYALLGLGAWSPKFFWHWLPYAVLMTLPVGPLCAGAGKQRVIGWVLMLFVALISSWLLVPTWPHLEPSRAVHWAIWIPAVASLAILLEPLAQTQVDDETPVQGISAGAFVVTLTGTLFTTVIIIFLSGSLRFAQLAGAGFATLTGMSLAVLLDRKANTIAGTAPTFAILIGGLLLVAQVDSFSSVPLVSYILPPLAPLSLWFAAIKPMRNWQGWQRWAALALPPLLLLTTALALALIAEFGSDETY